MSFAESSSYFSTAAMAAASLIGLLFVTVAIRPETIFGATARSVERTIAVSAFVALTNAFFISLAALLGHAVFGIAVVGFGLAGLVSLWMLSRARDQTPANILMAAVSIVAYLGQVVAGALIVVFGPLDAAVLGIALATMFAFAIALARAWLLLQGRHSSPTAPRSDSQAIDPTA